jgi:hypothetical protein
MERLQHSNRVSFRISDDLRVSCKRVSVAITKHKRDAHSLTNGNRRLGVSQTPRNMAGLQRFSAGRFPI